MKQVRKMVVDRKLTDPKRKEKQSAAEGHCSDCMPPKCIAASTKPGKATREKAKIAQDKPRSPANQQSARLDAARSSRTMAKAAVADPLAALTPAINSGVVDSLRLIKAAALRAIETGQQLTAARALVGDDKDWRLCVEKNYPISVREGTFFTCLAKRYGAIKDRLSPATRIGMTEVLQILVDTYLATADPPAVLTSPQSTRAKTSSQLRPTIRTLKKPR